jgi:hypothetical protein
VKRNEALVKIVIAEHRGGRKLVLRDMCVAWGSQEKPKKETMVLKGLLSDRVDAMKTRNKNRG